MLIQYIVGGYINPPLPVSVNLLGTKTPPRQAPPATPPKEGNVLMQILFQQPQTNTLWRDLPVISLMMPRRSNADRLHLTVGCDNPVFLHIDAVLDMGFCSLMIFPETLS